jgi:hypothetical protein
MADEKAVEQAAREFIEQYGGDAVRVARQLAEAAAEIGDEATSKAWRDIAEAAERMLNERRARERCPC